MNRAVCSPAFNSIQPVRGCLFPGTKEREKASQRWRKPTDRGLKATRALLALALVLLLVGAGCAGYKLGPTGEQRAGEKSIQVNPVVNATLEPQLGPAVNHALRKEIQQDGTFRLATHGDGDIALNLELVRYHRRGIAYDPNNTITATDYELILEARVLATDRRSGREMLNKEVRSRTTIRIGPDLTSTERQARPLLAGALAGNIVSLLANGEW